MRYAHAYRYMIVTRKSLDIPSGMLPCCSGSTLSNASDESDEATSVDAESANDGFSNSAFSHGSTDILADGFPFPNDLVLPNVDLTTPDHDIDAVGSMIIDSPPTTDEAPNLDFEHFQWLGAQDTSSCSGNYSELIEDSLSPQQLQLAVTDPNNHNESPSPPLQNEVHSRPPPDQTPQPGRRPSTSNPNPPKPPTPRYIIRLDEANHETILVVMNILIKSKARVRFEAA